MFKRQMTDSQELAMAIYMANMYFYQKIEPKDGMPQILHSIRVMLAGKTAVEQTVGMLHDTVEDTAITLRDLGAWGFSDSVLEAVDALTRRKDEPYETYLQRIKTAGPLAVAVKVNDLTDNIGRAPPINEAPDVSMKRKAKYIRARAMLETRPILQNL